MIPAEVVNQRQHQGFDTPSYLLRYSKSGSLTTRNERDIRRFPGDGAAGNSNPNVDNTVNNMDPAIKSSQDAPSNI